MINSEKYIIGKALKKARIDFGYSRRTFGMMLGYTPEGAHRSLQKVECGSKRISVEKIDRVNQWQKEGLPNDAPMPDLVMATISYREKYKAQQPKTLELTTQESPKI